MGRKTLSRIAALGMFAMTFLFVMSAGAAVIGGGLFFGLRRKKEDDED